MEKQVARFDGLNDKFDRMNGKLDWLIKSIEELTQIVKNEGHECTGASSSNNPLPTPEIPVPETINPRVNVTNLEAGNSIPNFRNMDTGFNGNVKVDFPRFNGEFPRNWIRLCQRYFALYPMLEHEKVLLNSMHLEEMDGNPQGKSESSFSESTNEKNCLTESVDVESGVVNNVLCSRRVNILDGKVWNPGIEAIATVISEEKMVINEAVYNDTHEAFYHAMEDMVDGGTDMVEIEDVLPSSNNSRSHTEDSLTIDGVSHITPKYFHDKSVVGEREETIDEEFDDVVESKHSSISIGSVNLVVLHHVKHALPTLWRYDYHSKPWLSDLANPEFISLGYCSRVQDFVVGGAMASGGCGETSKKIFKAVLVSDYAIGEFVKLEGYQYLGSLLNEDNDKDEMLGLKQPGKSIGWEDDYRRRRFNIVSLKRNDSILDKAPGPDVRSYADAMREDVLKRKEKAVKMEISNNKILADAMEKGINLKDHILELYHANRCGESVKLIVSSEGICDQKVEVADVDGFSERGERIDSEISNQIVECKEIAEIPVLETFIENTRLPKNGARLKIETTNDRVTKYHVVASNDFVVNAEADYVEEHSSAKSMELNIPSRIAETTTHGIDKIESISLIPSQAVVVADIPDVTEICILKTTEKVELQASTPIFLDGVDMAKNSNCELATHNGEVNESYEVDVHSSKTNCLNTQEDHISDTTLMDVAEEKDLGVNEPASETENLKFTNEQMMKFTSSLKRNLSGYLSPSENENVFSLSDLVSVKVWGRPWWPRQIVDPALFSVLNVVWQRKKYGQTRHICIKIVQQIGILTRCVILPRSRSLVEMIEHCVSDENWKVRTIITLFFAALAEGAAPYGIEGWDSILGSLWKEIRSNQEKS